MLGVIAKTRCVSEVHVGRAARDAVDPESPVRAESVRRLRDLLDRPPTAADGPPTSRLRPPPPTSLSQNLRHDVAVDVGQPEVASLEAIRQFLVIDAERVQDGGLQVVDGHRIRHDVVAELVGLAEHEPALRCRRRPPTCRSSRG